MDDKLRDHLDAKHSLARDKVHVITHVKGFTPVRWPLWDIQNQLVRLSSITVRFQVFQVFFCVVC